MDAQEIISKVKSLNFPKGSYIVYGSCPMALAGIRKAGDIDFLVNKDVFEMLKNQGWQQISKGPKDNPVIHDVFEAHPNWDFSSYKPTLEHLLASATVVDNVPFASLEEVRKWKHGSGRPKTCKILNLLIAT